MNLMALNSFEMRQEESSRVRSRINIPKRAKQQLARVGSNRAVRPAFMVALSLHLLALTAAYYPVPVVQPPEQYQYYAYEPAPQFLARSGDVQMSTQYQPGVFAAIGRKKDPRTGQTKSHSLFLFPIPIGERFSYSKKPQFDFSV